MTAAAIGHMSLAAGSALVGAAGRAALWGLGRYAKAPLSNSAIVALVCFSLTAGANALYFQGHPHPAPLFGTASHVALAQPVPVVPAVRKGKAVVPAVEKQTLTGSVPAKPATAPAAEPIGNAEVFEIQRKLSAFGYFDGTVDGYYGPKTARAIKRFEEAHGMKVKGELTREVIAAIVSAPITSAIPQAQPIVALEPVPESTPVVSAEPVAQHLPKVNLATETIAIIPPATDPQPEPQAAVEVLPTPAPLEATLAAPATRPLPRTPQEAVNIAVAVAGNAVDAAVDAMQGKVQLGPAQPLPPKPAPVLEEAAASAPARTVEVMLPPEAAPAAEIPADEPVSSTDPKLVAKVQQGLSNLGFLHGTIDGVAGEATAKAIRNFEVYFNFQVTGRVTPQLVDLLTDAGAYI